MEREGVLFAPVSGTVIEMVDVPDPVFAAGMLGAGCGILPEGEVALSPVAGTVTAMMGHAVAIRTDDGVDVLVHVGIDTVEMGGSGFDPKVAKGTRVEVGDPLTVFDRAAIVAAGHSDCIVLAVSNAVELADVTCLVRPGTRAEAGQPLLKTSV